MKWVAYREDTVKPIRARVGSEEPDTSASAARDAAPVTRPRPAGRLRRPRAGPSRPRRLSGLPEDLPMIDIRSLCPLPDGSSRQSRQAAGLGETPCRRQETEKP